MRLAGGCVAFGGLLSVRVDAIWNSVGGLVYATCQFGMIAVLAKVGTSEQVGQFSVAMAVSSSLVSLCMLHLRGLQLTESSTQGFAFSDYAGIRIVGMLVAMVGIVGIAEIGYGRNTARVICAVGVAKVVEAFSDVAYGFLQRHADARRVAVSQILRGMLALVAVYAGVAIAQSVAVAGLLLAGVWLLVLLLVDWPGVVRVVGDFEASLPAFRCVESVSLARLAMPLGVAMGLGTVIGALPRLLLERSYGLAEVGAFSAMMTLALPGNIITAAVAQAFSPRLSSCYRAGDDVQFCALMRKLGWVTVSIGCISGGVVWFSGRWLLEVLYSAEIAGMVKGRFFVVVAAVVWCLTTAAAYGATAMRRLRAQLVANIVALVVTLGVCLLLIPVYGMPGAAMCVVGSSAVSLLVLFAAILQE